MRLFIDLNCHMMIMFFVGCVVVVTVLSVLCVAATTMLLMGVTIFDAQQYMHTHNTATNTIMFT